MHFGSRHLQTLKSRTSLTSSSDWFFCRRVVFNICSSTLNSINMKSFKKYLPFLFIGIFFGIIMTKSEAVSWYRIQEMFRFQSFHMYGIIGVAAGSGMVIMQLIKRFEFRNRHGKVMAVPEKPKLFKANILGGTAFGIGWPMTGACPGPLYVLVEKGFLVIPVVLASAVLGTFCYGLLRDKLPH